MYHSGSNNVHVGRPNQFDDFALHLMTEDMRVLIGHLYLIGAWLGEVYKIK